MAKLIVNLRIEDADSPKQAVGLAQEVWAMLNTRLKGTPHTVTGKVQIPCPDCGENLTVQDRELVCLNCEAQIEAEWSWEAFVEEVTNPKLRGKRFRDTAEQSLEALLM